MKDEPLDYTRVRTEPKKVLAYRPTVIPKKATPRKTS